LKSVQNLPLPPRREGTDREISMQNPVLPWANELQAGHLSIVKNFPVTVWFPPASMAGTSFENENSGKIGGGLERETRANFKEPV
jgi:hypothetical protein